MCGPQCGELSAHCLYLVVLCNCMTTIVDWVIHRLTIPLQVPLTCEEFARGLPRSGSPSSLVDSVHGRLGLSGSSSLPLPGSRSGRRLDWFPDDTRRADEIRELCTLSELGVSSGNSFYPGACTHPLGGLRVSGFATGR